MKNRKRLIVAAEQILVPDLKRNGFEPYYGIRDANADMRAYAPLGHFRRMNGTEMECVDLNFGKVRHSGFFLSVGKISADGVKSFAIGKGMVPQHECTAESASPHFRITPHWYDLGAKMFKSNSKNGQPDQIVDLARTRLLEGLSWFKTGKVGWHMRRYN